LASGSVSAVHRDHPYIFRVGDHEYRVNYSPGEGNTYLFGGNSNWRGPIWFPINYPLLEALKRYHHFYGGALKVECPVRRPVGRDFSGDEQVRLRPRLGLMVVWRAHILRILEQAIRGSRRLGVMCDFHHDYHHHSIYGGRVERICRRLSRDAGQCCLSDEGSGPVAASFYLLKQDVERVSRSTDLAKAM